MGIINLSKSKEKSHNTKTAKSFTKMLSKTISFASIIAMSMSISVKWNQE